MEDIKRDGVSQVVNELLRQSRILEKKDRERAEWMGALVRRPEWLEFEKLLNELIEQKGLEVLAPAMSIDGAVALEHIKGAMCGLILARDLPHVVIAQMKATRGLEDSDE